MSRIGFADRQAGRSARGWGDRQASGTSGWLRVVVPLLVVAALVGLGGLIARPEPLPTGVVRQLAMGGAEPGLADLAPLPDPPTEPPVSPPNPPASLPDARLEGARSPDPVHFVVLADVSGSFAPYDQLRQAALQEVLDWAVANLRPDDTIAIISFATGAAENLPTTRVGDIGPVSLRSRTDLGGGSLIVPALRLAVQTKPDSVRTTSLIALTDTMVTDADRWIIDPLLTSLNATTMSLILPRGEGLDPGWDEAFPLEIRQSADPDDTGAIALAVGQAMAHGTGQRLA